MAGVVSQALRLGELSVGCGAIVGQEWMNQGMDNVPVADTY